MDQRVKEIRKEEKAYHDKVYEELVLFEPGSWLRSPVRSVIQTVDLFEHKNIHVLDLGSGVGRNSIPIAQKVQSSGGMVTCVDLLESAIVKLRDYRLQYGVENQIKGFESAIEDFRIDENTYDYIVAVSSLEHCASLNDFKEILSNMRAGTRERGIHYLVINTDMEEIDMTTGKRLNVQLEVDLSTRDLDAILTSGYQGWDVLDHHIKELTFEIERNGLAVQLNTKAVTFVVRKP
ncbi:class I SAM-dependent methyltransferase [Jeotgalibacillus aurantiacus]|uniref:class I SAM-dependent methyltransferase n=1 Tax=Jeotgalibacillus aurantiacus TaxID=2763266 RepID=UPI001D0A7ED0|nr:class I SAM-dependent methyltransferase [Jeotgalibacillus aurantiacus]